MVRPKTFSRAYSKKLLKYIITLIVALFAADFIQGDGRILDGDTIKIGTQRIRLQGIDALETKQTCQCAGKTVYCGQQATQALKDFVRNKEIYCTQETRDHYGRIVGECFVKNEIKDISLNQFMVRNGYAVAYAQYSKKFVPDEKIAKQNKQGIWACKFDLPWVYRRTKK